MDGISDGCVVVGSNENIGLSEQAVHDHMSVCLFACPACLGIYLLPRMQNLHGGYSIPNLRSLKSKQELKWSAKHDSHSSKAFESESTIYEI